MLHLVGGNNYVCAKFEMFFLSNEALWVSLIDKKTDDDLG